MTSVTPVELAVGTDQSLTVTAIDPLLMVVIFAEVFISLRCPPGGVWATTKQGKIFCERGDVPVLNKINCLTRRAFEFVVSVGGSGVVSSGGPFTPSVTNVQNHLLVFVFFLVDIQQLIQAF